MKILHMRMGTALINFAIISFMVIYLIRFYNKPHKNHLDILKLLWITTMCIIAILRFMHIIPSAFLIISHTLFIITLIDFSLMEFNIIDNSKT